MVNAMVKALLWQLVAVPLLLIGFADNAAAAVRRIQFGTPTSELGFRAYGLGLVPIDAHFAQFGGWLTYDPADHTNCRVELAADVDSLITDDPSVRATVIGAEFLDVAHFPLLTYVGSCEAQGLGGMLGMHGVTRPFVLSLTWTRDGVEAEGRLLRADWGMTARPFMAGRTVRIRVVVPFGGASGN
jgi:polyisoprenoid-binding protein YceI